MKKGISWFLILLITLAVPGNIRVIAEQNQPWTDLTEFGYWEIADIYQAPDNPKETQESALKQISNVIAIMADRFETNTVSIKNPQYSFEECSFPGLLQLGFSAKNINRDFSDGGIIFIVTEPDTGKQYKFFPLAYDEDHLLYLADTGYIYLLSYYVEGHSKSTPSSWAKEEMDSAKRLGLVTPRTTIDYQKDITREEFCELAVTLYEELSSQPATTKGRNVFLDTQNPKIMKAYDLGIVKGVSADMFEPNKPISRQEIAVMLVRTIHAALPNVVIPDLSHSGFADNAGIADWAMSSVCFASQKGIVNGVGNNIFSPLTSTSCEQAIALVLRTYNVRNNF